MPDDHEIEVDFVYPTEGVHEVEPQHRAAKLLLDAADVAFRELRQDRDAWKERAEARIAELEGGG